MLEVLSLIKLVNRLQDEVLCACLWCLSVMLGRLPSVSGDLFRLRARLDNTTKKWTIIDPARVRTGWDAGFSREIPLIQTLPLNHGECSYDVICIYYFAEYLHDELNI